mmetsp:Transcript_8055/g.26369  ORF Transcript_8055/g.26369 Transcript_8055/m.26369 type:complete len:864 (-) Transcript_8055:343-2934(-)
MDGTCSKLQPRARTCLKVVLRVRRLLVRPLLRVGFLDEVPHEVPRAEHVLDGHGVSEPFRGQHVGHGHGGDQVPRLLRLELVRHDGQVRVQALEEQVRARDDWPPRRNEARVAGRPIPEKVRRALEATSFDRRPLLKVDHRAGVRAHHAEQQVAVLALPRQLGKVPPVADVRREEELVRGRDVRGLEGRQDCGELERVEGVHLGDGLCGDVLQQGLCLGVSGDFGVARVCERRGQRGQQRRRDAVAAESDFGDGGERVRKRIVLLWEEGFVDDAERAREFGRRLEGLGLRRVAEADRKVRGQRGVERLGHADLAVGDGDLCDFVEVEVVKVVVDHEARRQLLEEAFGYELVCPLLLRRRQEARRQHRPEVDHVASRRLCERRRPEGVARVVAVVLARVKVAVGEGPMDLAQGKGHLGELARLQLAAGQVFDARRHGAKDRRKVRLEPFKKLVVVAAPVQRQRAGQAQRRLFVAVRAQLKVVRRHVLAPHEVVVDRRVVVLCRVSPLGAQAPHLSRKGEGQVDGGLCGEVWEHVEGAFGEYEEDLAVVCILDDVDFLGSLAEPDSRRLWRVPSEGALRGSRSLAKGKGAREERDVVGRHGLGRPHQNVRYGFEEKEPSRRKLVRLFRIGAVKGTRHLRQVGGGPGINVPLRRGPALAQHGGLEDAEDALVIDARGREASDDAGDAAGRKGRRLQLKTCFISRERVQSAVGPVLERDGVSDVAHHSLLAPNVHDVEGELMHRLRHVRQCRKGPNLVRTFGSTFGRTVLDSRLDRRIVSKSAVRRRGRQSAGAERLFDGVQKRLKRIRPFAARALRGGPRQLGQLRRQRSVVHRTALRRRRALRIGRRAASAVGAFKGLYRACFEG